LSDIFTGGDYSSQLDQARGYSEIWDLVKETTKIALGEERKGMLLFLDDLPLRLGAYHQVGTNNIVLNRTLIEIVETTAESKQTVNAFIYVLLLHEYIHALGFLRETEVKLLVIRVAERTLGREHPASKLAQTSPWAALKNVPLSPMQSPKRVMEIVGDLEKRSQGYIV
jgi:hypothetical protein